MRGGGVGQKMQPSIGIALHLHVQQDAGIFCRAARHIRRRTGDVAAQLKPKTLTLRVVLHLLEYRLWCTPSRIPKEKSQAMPHLMTIHTQRTKTPANELERNRTGTQ